MSLVTEQHSMRNPRALIRLLMPVLHIGQSRNAVPAGHGFHLVEQTLQRFSPKFHTEGFRRN